MVAQRHVGNAVALAAAFDSVTAEQWPRPGRRSDGASFTVSSIAKYLVHDLVHHRWDVNRGKVEATGQT